ncbi:vacuolar protein sorting-associated protein [Thraustotheca clavata]|uniref:Vacuolar protein sorting-associated protein n=1 Tax=Thraustotheca clavata TaxID=74557 RepID=A0A1V9ZD75_9STRA|nr:vacuolar protein sorting-associated protein [Thraustotheca clavata]
MAKAVISSILQSQLGKYVDGLAPESLQVGLWSGELLLTNLKLKPLALAELNLPIKVLHGAIGKVHVLVPWNQLGSASVQITLEGIYGVAVPNTELPSEEEVLMGIRNRLERAELMRQHQLQSADGSTQQQEDSTFLTRLTTRIIDNLQIIIKDFHLRYEDVISNPALPFTCGIFFEKFSLETTDENGNKIFVDNTEKKGLTHKVVQVKNFAVYWDRLDPSQSMRNLAAFESKMRNIIYDTQAFEQSDRQWLLVPPCTMRVQLTKNESQIYSKTAPKYAIRALARGLTFGLSREQYDDMLFMHKAFLSRRAVEAHFWEHRHRPFLALEHYPIVWWDYATRFILATTLKSKRGSRFRWTVMQKMSRDRKMYIALYKQQRLVKTTTLTTSQLSYIQRLEDTFPMELVLRLREVAEKQYSDQKKAEAVAEPPATSSWYGFFFGESKTTTTSSIANDVFSDTGKADLKQAYDEIVALDEMTLPSDCYLLTVDLALVNGTVNLFGYEKSLLLSSNLSGSLALQVKPDQSWTSQLHLDALDIMNHRVAIDCASHHFCKLTDGSEIPFALSVAMPSTESMQIRLAAEPLQLILDPVFLLLLKDFFCGSVTSRQLDDVWAFATSSVQSYVFAEQEEADMLAAISMMETMEYDVIVDMKAPILLLPEDATTDASATIVFDFGRLKLTDMPPTSSHVNSWQIELSDMQVLLRPENGFSAVDSGIALMPQFNMTCNIDNMFREISGKPMLAVSANLPALKVFLSESNLLLLGRIHGSIYSQSQNAIQHSSIDVDDVDEPEFTPITKKSSTDREAYALAVSWKIATIDIELADSFQVHLGDTSFLYDMYTTKSIMVAQLNKFSVEDKAHDPSSPFYYLIKTGEENSHLVLMKATSSSHPNRVADTLVDVEFQVLDVQWNPSSILVLYTLFTSYSSSISTVSTPPTLVKASSSTVVPVVSGKPALKLSATLKEFSVAFNKDDLDRRLVRASMADATLEYSSMHDEAYFIDGTLGNFVVTDYSVPKHEMYCPFLGRDTTESDSSQNLLEFKYAVEATLLPTIDVHLHAIRIVYVHQQILELSDYLFQGVLGSLVNATLMNATQLLLKEEPAALKMHVIVEKPRIIIPMNPLDESHLVLDASSLEITHFPESKAAYVNGRIITLDDDQVVDVYSSDLKYIVLNQVMLYSGSNTDNYEPVIDAPLELGIDIHDIVSTKLTAMEGTVRLPRFSITCSMPHLHMSLEKHQYIMLVRILQENIGAASLYEENTSHSVSIGNIYRPAVDYEYARTDLEMATMKLAFSMASFECSLKGTGVNLVASNFNVGLFMIENLNPYIDVGLAILNMQLDSVKWLDCAEETKIRYEWDDIKKTRTMDLIVSDASGTVLPRALVKLADFFYMDANSFQQQPSAEIAVAEAEYEFHVNLIANKVGLSFPSDITDFDKPLLTISSDFDIKYDMFPVSDQYPIRQSLFVAAKSFETYLQHTNRQGCATSSVQIMEPCTVQAKYDKYATAQEVLEFDVSTVQVFVSYEDAQLITKVLDAMKNDVASVNSKDGLEALQSSTNMSANLMTETSRRITLDFKSMQLTLINDCDGCDMGLLQLRLPTCQFFVNANTNAEYLSITGGGDISFEATYYNPDSREWQPLCAEWKVNATVMASLAHVKSVNTLNRMDWHVSADPVKFKITHGLLEALASAGETWTNNKSKQTLQSPCTIKNESGLPIRFWWSAHPENVQLVDNGSSTQIHYVHVQGKGHGVTRTYTAHQREQGTVCLDLLGLDCQPVQGIVAEQLGPRTYSLIEEAGGLSSFRLTCTSQLVGGHIVLTISSHVRIFSHISQKVQLLVYDPSWPQPMDIGVIEPESSIALPIMYSLGSEIRLRCLGEGWNYSSPIPLSMSSSSLSVSCVHPEKVSYFSVSFEKGQVHLYDPLTIQNKCPVPIFFSAQEGKRGVPVGDQVDVGCSAGIWWCMQQPVFILEVPGCKRSSLLQLKKDSAQFSVVLRRIQDNRPMTILVAVTENEAKAATISLYADIWLINRTDRDLSFGNGYDDDNYHPPQQALCVLDNASMCMYSSSSKTLRVRLQTNWSENINLDPRRMDWQDECLSIFEGRRLYEFGISADYATRHFGVLTTIVTIIPRYLFVNRTPWTIVLLEEDSQNALSSSGSGYADHIIPSGESYALYWMGNSRQLLRASVIDCDGQSSWSKPFNINELNSLELLIPNDVSCPELQVVVKQGGLSQSTFVIDISNIDPNQVEEPRLKTWDMITVDVKLAELSMTLLDTSKEVDLFTGPLLDEVARFTISNIQYNLTKDMDQSDSFLCIRSMALRDLLPRSKYPIVLAPIPGKPQEDFIYVTYKSKQNPKYHFVELLQVKVRRVQLQTTLSFVNRINGLLSETLAHFESERSVDLLAYFTSMNDLSTLTGRKWFFKRFVIEPIQVTVSFTRDKDTSNNPVSNFWLSHLKLKIKDASLDLKGFEIANALATQESVTEALIRSYTTSVKSQALGLIESIQVLPLVTGVVTEGVTSLVSTILGKADSSLASSSFRRESLSNSGIVTKHSRAMQTCTSTGQFQHVIDHLVFDWDGNHTGLEARACLALGIINNSSQSIVIQASLRDGAELRLLPNGRLYMAPGLADWNSDRCLLLFAWGYTPTLLTTGDVGINVQSNAFILQLSKSYKRLQANPGYTATFTLQESQSWWSKHMIVISDELQTITPTINEDRDAYEVLFTESTLGIVAKQENQQTVTVRECCSFSNGQPSPALACGLISPGDRIISVNGVPVQSTQGFKASIVNTTRPIIVRFSRKPVEITAEDDDYNLFG